MEPTQPIEGSAALSPDGPVVAGSPGTWTLTYAVGEDEIQPGGVLRLTIPAGFTPPQVDHPGAPGFATASCTAARTTLFLVVEEDEAGNPEPGGMRGCDLKVFLDTAPVHRRERIVVVYGERSGGSPGAFAARVAGDAAFPVAVQTGRGETAFRTLRRNPVLRVVPDQVRRMVVVVPSVVGVEKPFPVNLLPRDAFGNVVGVGDGRVELRAERGDLKLPSDFALRTPEGAPRAAARVAGGPCRIRAIDRETGVEGVSNPFFAPERASELLLWGDLHGHSTGSGGSAPPEAYYAYGRDVACLDFAAITDHLGPDPGDGWESVRASASAFDAAGRFIPLIGFEDRDAPGGHRNAYFQGLDVRPPDPAGPPPEDGPGPGGEAGREGMLVVPHAHGRSSWASLDLRAVRLAEVYSCWGNAERWGVERSNTHPSRHPGGTIQAGLAYGLRLGLVAGSDTHTGFPGGALRVRLQPRHPGGLTAVYADAFTRPALWAGLRGRRCYATTGARIVLRFEVEGYPMGSEIDIGGPDDPLLRGRAISVKVYGTSRISRIDVVRNNADICSYRGDNDAVQFRWVDAQDLSRISTPRPACRHPLTCYYVRVIQEDGEMAWSSPVWLTLTYLP
jgi:hypothetical protein